MTGEDAITGVEVTADLVKARDVILIGGHQFEVRDVSANGKRLLMFTSGEALALLPATRLTVIRAARAGRGRA